MGRYYGEKYQPGGHGVTRGVDNAPRHTAGQGIFAYALTPDEKAQKSKLLQRMREKTAPTTEPFAISAEQEPGLIQLGNHELPSFAKKAEIVNQVTNNQVTVIVGPTGSGKSTQVPQFLLEAGFDHISVTQPRIMAANGVGERIADELEGSLGSEARNLVAVQHSERFDGQEQAKIFIRTDGLEQVLQLERYLSGLTAGEAAEVTAKTALIIDEVHESNMNQVCLLALVKRMMGMYPNLHVVVMSATANTEKYVNYFADGGTRDVPVVEIEGQPADLTWEERPDADATKVLAELIEDGDKLEPGDDILLFTSGVGEIETLIKKGLAAGLKIEFTMLHAKMSAADQARSIAEHPDTIRVIVCTDVAMTSMTFPHVKYVIDEGIVKNPELDEEGAPGLVTQICSQAEIRQRGGRAGRVRPGTHILVRPHEETGMPFISLEDRPEYPVPPIYATDLSSSVLQFADYGIDFEELDLIDEVSPGTVRAAKDKLYNLGALDRDDAVTDIGRLMNKFPVGTEYSRMIAEAMQPGVPLNVLVHTVMVASSYEAGGLRSFARKHQKGKEPWRGVAGQVENDALLERKLFQAAGVVANNSEQDFLRRYGYEPKNLKRARKAYRKCVKAIGLDPYEVPILPPDGDEEDMIRHCVAAGLVENIYTRSNTPTRYKKYKYRPAVGFGLQRELSSRSVVEPSEARMLVGMTRYYMSKTKNGWAKTDIVEAALPVTHDEIAKLDLRETVVDAGFVAQGGMLKVVQERRAGEIRRGTEIIVPQEGQVDEGIILKAALENPGPFQQQLKMIKRTLEQAQNLTRNTIPQVPQVQYENMLLQAVRRCGSTAFHEIDAMLGEIMREQGISLQAFLPDERAEYIRAAAVESVTVDDQIITLSYWAGVPVAQHVSPQSIEQLPDRVVIPDGREVMFRVPKLSKRDGTLARGYHDIPAHEAKRAVRKARELFGNKSALISSR